MSELNFLGVTGWVDPRGGGTHIYLMTGGSEKFFSDKTPKPYRWANLDTPKPYHRGELDTPNRYQGDSVWDV